MTHSTPDKIDERPVDVRVGNFTLEGQLAVPRDALGVVLFAHGSGSSRHSPRNRAVAEMLQAGGLATLLMDLLTPSEEATDQRTAELRFDIGLLAERLVGATDWLGHLPDTRRLNIGYFGASTGVAAALVAAAERPVQVRAIVSRGGRPDLAGDALARVQAPTLLLVGGDDVPVIGLNQFALEQLGSRARLDIIPEAGHLFEEPGKLEAVASRARDWFEEHLADSGPAYR